MVTNHVFHATCTGLASFPGSYMQGEPGIYSHVTMTYIIKIGSQFLEQKGNVFCIVPPAMLSMFGVYDIRYPSPDNQRSVVSCPLCSIFFYSESLGMPIHRPYKFDLLIHEYSDSIFSKSDL